MCKRFFNWLKCNQTDKETVAEPKRMNEEELNKRSSLWVPAENDVYMKIGNVAAILDVSMVDLTAKIPPIMKQVWINRENCVSHEDYLGFELGLNLQDICYLANSLGINDGESIAILQSEYKKARYNAYLD